MSTRKATFVETKVFSADGTPICCQSTGTGPGLVVVHGVLGAARHYRRLARALSGSFTVHVMDRRGRGHSGPQGDGYDMCKECEDVSAVLRETGSAFLFGHSYGGLIGLEAALKYPLVKLALYEPGVSVHQSIPHEWVAEFRRRMDRREYADALVLFIHGLRLISPFDKIPKRMLKLCLQWTVANSEKNETVKLLHTVEAEIGVVERLDSAVNRYRAIGADTLVLVGRKSPAYMFEAAKAVADVVPEAKLRALSRLDHMAPVLFHPRLLTRELEQFFILQKEEVIDDLRKQT